MIAQRNGTIRAPRWQGWSSPVPQRLVPTVDGESFRTMPPGWTGLPLGSHPGAFGVTRRHHTHEGVDLYVEEGTAVHAVEPGRVVAIVPFTGEHATPSSPWWHNTWTVLIEGASGVVGYGEIAPDTALTVGKTVERGGLVGTVLQVLQRDKGRPMSMLHLELYSMGTCNVVEWKVGDLQPVHLHDPTPLLMDAAMRGWGRDAKADDRWWRRPPAFVKAGQRLIPMGDVLDVDLTHMERQSVSVRDRQGNTWVAEGFDAIETVMATKPSALEGRRLTWKSGAWAFHNVVGHPVVQLLAWLGFKRAAVRWHDATTPHPRG